MATLASKSAGAPDALTTGSKKGLAGKENLLLALALCCMLAIAFLMNSNSAFSGWSGADEAGNASASVAALPREAQPVIPLQTFEELSAVDAEAKNAQRPLANRPLEIAASFHFPAGVANPVEWQRAVECLALANYYEAASEGPQGMRAVSQVVLNRVLHPAFPKSVCEVVFQGSERGTGCQFTFTCDGSLARPAVPALMARARTIAAEALQGRVEASVGMATHYHTKQVVPYWADSLDKVRVLGAHIFYVWRGGWGNRSAFRGRYAGEMSAVADRFLGIRPSDLSPTILAEPVSPQYVPGAQMREALAANRAVAKRTYLVADESRKGLKIDEAGNGGLVTQQVIHLSDERAPVLGK